MHVCWISINKSRFLTPHVRKLNPVYNSLYMQKNRPRSIAFEQLPFSYIYSSTGLCPTRSITVIYEFLKNRKVFFTFPCCFYQFSPKARNCGEYFERILTYQNIFTSFTILSIKYKTLNILERLNFWYLFDVFI